MVALIATLEKRYNRQGKTIGSSTNKQSNVDEQPGWVIEQRFDHIMVKKATSLCRELYKLLN